MLILFSIHCGWYENKVKKGMFANFLKSHDLVKPNFVFLVLQGKSLTSSLSIQYTWVFFRGNPQCHLGHRVPYAYVCMDMVCSTCKRQNANTKDTGKAQLHILTDDSECWELSCKTIPQWQLSRRKLNIFWVENFVMVELIAILIDLLT